MLIALERYKLILVIVLQVWIQDALSQDALILLTFYKLIMELVELLKSKQILIPGMGQHAPYLIII